MPDPPIVDEGGNGSSSSSSAGGGGVGVGGGGVVVVGLCGGGVGGVEAGGGGASMGSSVIEDSGGGIGGLTQSPRHHHSHHHSHHHHSRDGHHQGKSAVKYGELIILGYNGHLPPSDRGRRRSKFMLFRRQNFNGVKEDRRYTVRQPQNTQAILNNQQHSISYTMSRNQAVIVEYKPDPETDMFQIGRSSEPPIDFVVMDTVPGEKHGEAKVSQSTISRFACRIIAHRTTREARIYAAGFDSSRNIFLGEKATKWQNCDEMDGLTTNGILIMHPIANPMDERGEGEVGLWREVSVGGGVYVLRESRSSAQRGMKVEDEDNRLQDGTLIDLCGATLLWRSAEGLVKSPTKRHLEQMLDELNAGRPQCPVGLNTLVIPRKETLTASEKQPLAYLNCGHVQGLHQWGHEKDSNVRTCPMCLMVGPVVKLCMGIEPAFYVDIGPPTFCFNPCGHMATEKTVKYWASVPIPHGTNGFQAACPFCATALEGHPGYSRLIFQDNCD
ncbi:protein pellino isoform X2 [Hyalella azteca]|uniref:Protein pellino isoform X2 n=1 Tax=Hyalella azteca TaxID=294128 RepID=A0A8B7N428_HYAAZ|nr:protein pellino isoform X2 [Hyalella azteca]